MKASFSMQSALDARRGVSRDVASRAEAFLRSLGADPRLVEAVLGDLAEEFASRRVLEGARAAHWWYLREALRSSPHLMASVLRGTSHGRRAAYAAGVATRALAGTVLVSSMLAASHEPARLIMDGDMGDGVVINDIKPVRLTVGVVNASGRALPDSGVRFRWLAGAPLAVSARGITQCDQPGDALVQATLGSLATRMIVRCRPVYGVRALWMMNLIVGDPPEKLPFEAIDSAGSPVALLRGEIGAEDTSVVALDVAADGTRLVRARAPGSTVLDLHIGSKTAFTSVHVYARARSPEGIRPGQRLATSVDLGSGELREWHLPPAREVYYVAMLPRGDELNVPRLAIVGANCITALDAHSYFCVALHGATVYAYHSRKGDQGSTVRGALAVWRRDLP